MGHYHWRTYLGWMSGTALALVAACGAINYAIDALGIFGTPRVAGINATKPYLDHHRELSRWQAARRVCAKAGIFGNSRAEIGFDPEHLSFAAVGLDAFNHAIPGTGIDTSLRQLRWLKAAGCAPRTVVLGVEFFDFLGGWAPKAPTTAEAAPSLDGAVWAETVFSLTALRDSAATLALQHARYPATITPRGFNPLRHYELEVQQSGHNTLFRQRGAENLKSWMRKPQRLLTEAGGSSVDQLGLEAFLLQTAPAASTVHLVIYPYHAEVRLMIERAGLGGLFAAWKASVLKTAQQSSAGTTRVQVWDFSGIGPETSEPIPPPGDRTTRMKGYWEAGHFKSTLGDQILAQVVGNQPGFGRALKPEMLDDYLQRDRQAAQDALNQSTDLTAEVNRLFSGLPGRP
jgi:hypothetical protein